MVFFTGNLFLFAKKNQIFIVFVMRSYFMKNQPAMSRRLRHCLLILQVPH